MITLHGNTWNHERGLAPMLATAESYQATQPDVRAMWEARTLQDFASFSVVELAKEYDILVIDHPHMGEVAHTGALVPLDDVIPANELAEIERLSVGPSYDSYVYDGHLWALPIDGAGHVAAYRPDLLEEEDVPSTWDEVAELAERGLVLWPLKPVDAVCSFFTLTASRGTPCFDETGAFVAEADAIAVLEEMARVAAHVPPECHTWNPIATLSALGAEDQTRCYIPLTFGYTNYSRADFVPRRVRAADIPALGDRGPVGSVLGGAGFAIASRCAHVEAAARYAVWVASPEVQRTTYVTAGGQPALTTAWDDAAANAATDGFFRRTRASMEGSWQRPRDAGFIAFQDGAGDIISQYLREGGDLARTVAALQDLHQQTMRKR